MQIKQISLYGINGERRDVLFKLSQVNIITGASKKGKSSLIDILEYCLGSSECNVAEGYIRQTVSWYSVLLAFPDSEVFIAREAPLQGRNTSSASHLLLGEKVDVPEHHELEASTNIESVVKFLTSKLGIPEQVTEVPEEQTRATTNISFKHSKFYLFQSQDEVAAKRILFHRQSEPYIPQSIIDTLPYFMGAAEDDRLQEIEKLRGLKRDRTRVIKRIKENEALKGNGLRKGYDLLSEAVSVGLYNGKNAPGDSDLVKILNGIVGWTPSEDEDKFLEGDPIYELEKEYRKNVENKKIIRSKIRAASEYAGSIGGYEKELSEQSLRLKSIGLYKKLERNSVCALCDREHDKASDEGIIKSAIEALSAKLDGVSRNKPRVTAYLSGLKIEDSELAERIKKCRDAIRIIKDKEFEAVTKKKLDSKRLMVIGRISLYLESIDFGDDVSLLKNDLKILEPQIEELERKLAPSALKERLESQLSCIAEDMTSWARDLGLEHSEHPIRLDASKLTVVAETPHGRTPLYRMGSGENWVGYHLVTYLALAKWFIEQGRPVGRFVFFDQPTQVYFPSDQAITGDLKEISDDEDREAVKKMFEWIFKIASEIHPHLQVIIADHADIHEDWFQSAIIDKKWRGDNALIPKHWYEK